MAHHNEDVPTVQKNKVLTFCLLKCFNYFTFFLMAIRCNLALFSFFHCFVLGAVISLPFLTTSSNVVTRTPVLTLLPVDYICPLAVNRPSDCRIDSFFFQSMDFIVFTHLLSRWQKLFLFVKNKKNRLSFYVELELYHNLIIFMICVILIEVLIGIIF